MTRRRFSLCLCILSAVAFSAIAAETALAGQTAFTCVSTASILEFKTNHCVPGETGTAFGHVSFTEETHAKFSNERTDEKTEKATATTLKQEISATKVEIKAAGAIEGLGALRNEELDSEMRASAESNTSGIAYNGVKVEAPAGKGCKVFEDKGGVKGAEGIIKTQPVKGHTTATGAVDEVVIEPVTSELFATFFLECTPGLGVPEAIEGTWEVSGSLKCPSHGATIACVHQEITGQKTLQVAVANAKHPVVKAGLEGKMTITAGRQPPTEPTSPVSSTTTAP